MSILGSAFLGALAAAPPLVEKVTGLTAFRGFAGTSLLILVGVATDTARKVKAEPVRRVVKFFFFPLSGASDERSGEALSEQRSEEAFFFFEQDCSEAMKPFLFLFPSSEEAGSGAKKAFSLFPFLPLASFSSFLLSSSSSRSLFLSVSSFHTKIHSSNRR